MRRPPDDVTIVVVTTEEAPANSWIGMFDSIAEHWLSGGASDLWLRADSIASALDAVRAG